MHNHDEKYPFRPGFEPGTPRLQAPVNTNEPSRPAGAIDKAACLESQRPLWPSSFKETKCFLPTHSWGFNIVESLLDREAG